MFATRRDWLRVATANVLRGRARLLFASTALLLLMTVPVVAQETKRGQSADAMKIPQTAMDHYEMAGHDQKVEAENRQDAATHRQMLTEFSKGVAKNPQDRNENAYIKNMRLHCEKYIKAEEALATEAAEFARFHTRRAKELEGK